MRKPELLAPAGDLERLEIALLYGADAVYIGGEFSLRANASNFKIEEIKQGVEYAHKMNKKVYVTVNIALHNEEAEKVFDYINALDKINVDAIIVSDPSILIFAKENTSLDVHISTQASSLNKETVNFWYSLGANRVVLARECTKEEIKDIKENTKAELEVFIHGAMCASYSGRCVLSNYLTNRDSNRGGCSQICRWDFDLLEENNHLKGDKPFTFCTKDLSLAEYIPDLMEIGVDSLKIEGRMRSSYYIATIVKVYRKIIDEYYHKRDKYEYNLKDKETLKRCANRDNIPQFFNGVFDKSVQYYNGRCEITNQDFLGTVLSYDKKNNLALLMQRNYFKKGDKVEIFGPKESFTFVIDKIYDTDKNEIDVVRHPKQIVYISVPNDVKENFMMKKA